MFNVNVPAPSEKSFSSQYNSRRLSYSRNNSRSDLTEDEIFMTRPTLSKSLTNLTRYNENMEDLKSNHGKCWVGVNEKQYMFQNSQLSKV